MTSALRWTAAVADGGGGDAELLAGQGEAPVAGGGLEEAQAVERRRDITDSGPRETVELEADKQKFRNCTNTPSQ